MLLNPVSIGSPSALLGLVDGEDGGGGGGGDDLWQHDPSLQMATSDDLISGICLPPTAEASLTQLIERPPPPPWTESPATDSIAPTTERPLGTPLHLALEKNDEGMIMFLVNSGATLGPIGANGQTALHVAVEVSNEVLLGYIARKTKDVNQVNRAGQTALMTAVVAGRVEAVETLLKRDADANWKDATGRTAMHYAVQEGSRTMAALLLKHEAKIDG